MGHPHYSRAPIIEAVIDIRVEAAASNGLASIESAKAELSAQFPIANPVHQGQLEVAFAPFEKSGAPSVKTEQRQLGFRLANKENTRVLQLRVNGLTYSHLAPYSDWSTFSAEAQKLWAIYASRLRPKRVTRLAVRYINRLDLPGESVEPEDYLTLYAKTPKDIPSDITGMFLQLRMPQSDIDATAVINSALVDSPLPQAISIILDFDVFKDVDIAATNRAIWSELDTLRDRKNRLFNSCITERTKELII